MTSKLGVGIVVAVAALFAMPSDVFAASSKATKNKIKKYFNQLKKLPNKAAPAGKVSNLVKKLSKLDPKKANKYYKTGLKKLAPTQANKKSATKLATDVTNIVKKSGLPKSQVNKINKQVKADEKKFTPTPTPTPVSPTASILQSLPVPAIA